jgi:PAS domain S-box-containing protein
MDRDYNFIRVNRSYASADGKDPDFFIGKNHFELYPHAENEAIFRRVVETGQPYIANAKPFEYLDHPEWGVTYWDWTLVPVFGAEKMVTGLVLTLLNVTERKRAEDALRESEEKYRILVERSNDGIVIIQDGIIKFANTHLAQLWGGNVEGLLETPIIHHIHPDERDKVMGRYKRRLDRENTPPIYETILLRKDGTAIYIEINAGVINYNGKPADLVMIRDITERKRTDEALQKSAQQYHTILQTTLDGFWILDLQGHFIDVNEAYCRIIGYSREELLGMTIRDVESLETDPELRQHFQNIIDNGYDFFETRHRRKDGRNIDVEASVKYLPDEGKLVVFLRDITQRKKTEESLRASLDEKTILLHEVHHRVKNNLQIVSSLLNLQATRIKNRETIEALRETGNRIQSMALLHETLNISGNLSRVNFSTYIKNICFHIFSSYGSKAENIKLENKITDILVDLDQAVPCGLIINELVSNALKHAFPEGRKGRITVELQALPDDQIMLTVADDGIGLPPGLDIGQTETLGLKLVTILTEKLKGIVEIIRAPGTTFHIVFKGKINKGVQLNETFK